MERMAQAKLRRDFLEIPGDGGKAASASWPDKQ
jgi:hypothetical protein